MMKQGWLIWIACICLTGCMTDDAVYAPVTEISTIQSIPKSGVYRVSVGDTLYSIAFRYGMDYRVLASQNHLVEPYVIHRGQVLALKQKHMPPLSRVAEPLPLKPKRVSESSFIPSAAFSSVTQWRWPATGSLIREFGGLNKGINIGGRIGDPVFASARGQVVYSGNGIRGYGNLIIIKHNDEFLTAYAHNSEVFVREGQWVQGGQRIALMGKTGTRQPMLHFEIRKSGLPQNPLMYLTRRGPV